MELKNAVAVCLISLFSATLVVLIARSLDSQAASQLEPQLASIVEELRRWQPRRCFYGKWQRPGRRRRQQWPGRLLLSQQCAMSDVPIHRVPGRRDSPNPLRLAVEEWRDDLESRQL